MSRIVIDTGPLVALLSRNDRHHAWVREVLDTVEPPVVTCEAVISEACFLLARVRDGQDAVFELLSNDIVKVDFRMFAEVDALRALMKKFSNVPMSLADACLVRMSELDPRSRILTLNGDFRIYRRNRRQAIPTIMPGRKGASARCDSTTCTNCDCLGIVGCNCSPIDGHLEVTCNNP